MNPQPIRRQRTPGARKVSLLSVFLFPFFAFPLLSLRAGLIAVDGDVPAMMNAVGTLGDPAQYIIGNTGAFTRDFGTGTDVSVGNTNSYNILTIQLGSKLLNRGGAIGYGSNANSVTVSGAGSAWTNSSLLSIGEYGGSGNTLSIANGAVVENTVGAIGYSGSANANSVTVSGTGSTWTNFVLYVGHFGSSNTLSIADGAVVENAFVGYVGYGDSSNAALGSTNSVTVSGAGSTWTNTGDLIVGRYGSDNTLSIADGALVKVGDAIGETISFSTLGGTNNHLRLDGGYIALFGDQTAYASTLIAAGRIQLWDGSEWVTTIDSGAFDFAYFATEEAAEAFSGYSGLAGYTILTAQAVPEPGAASLLVLGLGSLFLSRRRPAEKAL